MTTNLSWTPMEGLNYWQSSRPDAPYLIQPIAGEISSFTWRRVAEQSKAISGYLRSLGMPPGSRVATISRNCSYSIIAELAIWQAGLVSVPLYPSLNADSVRYILDHSDAQLAFLGALDDWNLMREGLPESLPKVLFPTFSAAPPPHSLSWNALLSRDFQQAKEHSPNADELARLIYTSGSTGQPKGVMISYGAMSAASDILLNLTQVESSDRLLSYLPLAHVFEAAIVLISSLRFGFEVYFSESLETFSADLKRARPTIFHSVPRLWVKFQQGVQQKIGQHHLDMMLSNPDTADTTRMRVLESLGLQHARVAITGSAPLAPSVMRWYRDLGLELLEGYGMSEDFAHSHCSRPGNSRIGYVGPANRGVRSRISPQGEIQVDSPAKMMGYFKDADKTAQAFTEDGWFKTGDLGEYDDAGRLRISGRLKEIFKTSKGKYVAPSPIEGKMSHPLVEAACVSGANAAQPHVLLLPSEAARTAASTDAGKAELSTELVRLLDAVNSTLEHHEQIAFAVVVQEPWSVANGLLTPTLKIKRQQIEDRYAKYVDTWYQAQSKLIWH